MIVPNLIEPLQAVGIAAQHGAPQSLLHLVHLRTSQINRCAFCIDMHVRLARKAGETEDRLHAVAAWHESPLFTAAERAVLALTEAATRLEHGVDDDVWAEAARYFDEAALATIVTNIALTNFWNRVNVTTKQVAGSVKWG